MSHDYSEDILIQESTGHLLERERGWEIVLPTTLNGWAKTACRNFAKYQVQAGPQSPAIQADA